MSQDKITITVTERESKGKGANKRLRVEGKIPCILYGHGVEPLPLTAELSQIIPANRPSEHINLKFRKR